MRWCKAILDYDVVLQNLGNHMTFSYCYNINVEKQAKKYFLPPFLVQKEGKGDGAELICQRFPNPLHCAAESEECAIGD